MKFVMDEIGMLWARIAQLI